MKSKGLPYLLCTHEFSASTMADGYARATGKPGVLAIVPGPGVTNSLTGIGEALVDSIPLVAIVGDIAQGEKFRPFQVHCLDQVALLKPVTKGVFHVEDVGQIAAAIRHAFALAMSGEPGPVAVVIPYTLLVDTHDFKTAAGRSARPARSMRIASMEALKLLVNKRYKRIGIYAGQGCMNYSDQLVQLAEVLQAPVATSVSGKGAFPECHPLSVGWGYGSHATGASEQIFNPINPMEKFGSAAGDRRPLQRSLDRLLQHAEDPARDPRRCQPVQPRQGAQGRRMCYMPMPVCSSRNALSLTRRSKRKFDGKLQDRIKAAKADDLRRLQQARSDITAPTRWRSSSRCANAFPKMAWSSSMSP